MSEDRLEQALEGMKSEDISAKELAGARDRVWAALGNPVPTACAEFEPGIREYVENGLVDHRRMLMEDHLSRCPRCRARMAELRGDRKVVEMPRRVESRWQRMGAWAAAAAVLLGAIYIGRHRIDTLMAPGGPRATVSSVQGSLFRLPGEALQNGAALGQDEVIRTGPDSRVMLRLADGSTVEVNQRTELSVSAAWSGQTIHLQRGDIIVRAAKQRRGHLRVQTRESVASVKGTVFAVSAGLGGSVVSVVEGSVEVSQPGANVVLKPGEQAASDRKLAHSVQEAVAWSPDADTYISLLASLSRIEKGVAALPSPALRMQSSLLQFLPPEPAVYLAMPNIGGTIRQAMTLVEQQAAENPAFSNWWNSSAGQELRQLVDRVQTVTPLLGDEIVFVLASAPSTPAGAETKIPMLLAETQSGRQAELAQALEVLRSQVGAPLLPFRISGTLLVASDSEEHLQWVLGNLGRGAASTFAGAIASRYQRGAGWLLGMDMAAAVPTVTGEAETKVLGAQQMKYLFLEQRAVLGVEENELTLTFQGPRMGMASWLASSGSGGAAEYLSGDAAFSVFVSTREPRQLFDELTSQLSGSSPSSTGVFQDVEEKLGTGFAANLASAFGTESAFALEGFSTTGPLWVLAVLVNNPSTVDSSIQRLVDAFNAELAPEDQAKRVSLTQETSNGRVWMTLKSGQFPLSATWTYDEGYLVAASDQGAALRAIANRNGGSSLVRSSEFRQQLPSSAGLHPSGFVWLNTKGALEVFAGFVSNPTLQKVISERDPILVVFSGTTEQIHSASRTRISGLIMDAMLLESLSRVRGGAQNPASQQAGAGKR
jgi:hypothetical protein